MSWEIERKFLVTDVTVLAQAPGTGIVQGYFATSGERSIRVRIEGDLAVLTVKGPRHGATRFEAECQIPREIADQLMEECRQPVVVKTRYPIFQLGRMWTIDVFHDSNDGLVIAEVELGSEDEPYEKPPWCGEEVTHDGRYYNEALVTTPFASW